MKIFNLRGLDFVKSPKLYKGEKMKIGEIKKQSLLLIFPEIEARFDSEDEKSVSEGIAELKCDPSIRSYLECSVPAINRALCEIEKAGATRVKEASVLLNGSVEDFGNQIPDLYRVLKISQNGKLISFSQSQGAAFISGAQSGEAKITYKASVPKIRYVTSDSEEIDLDFGVCALIPYFVAGELCEVENEARAKILREKFFGGLDYYTQASALGSEVEAVYSW